jgi:hypothetical protein
LELSVFLATSALIDGINLKGKISRVRVHCRAAQSPEN